LRSRHRRTDERTSYALKLLKNSSLPADIWLVGYFEQIICAPFLGKSTGIIVKTKALQRALVPTSAFSLLGPAQKRAFLPKGTQILSQSSKILPNRVSL
jgi:hypothetical protein